MRLIIAGSRSIHLEVSELYDIITEKLGPNYWALSIDEIVSGCAIGIDRSGEDWARAYNVPVKRFPAAWREYGKAAGPMRNLRMAEYADALLLIWDGKSKGSANMKARMMGMKKPIYEVIKGA